MIRRDFLKLAGSAGLLAVLQAAGLGCTDRAATGFAFPELPYPAHALEPVLSEKTISFHYGRHHRGYVARASRLAAEGDFRGIPLAEVVRRSAGSAAHEALFRNAAQAWNHQFYWRSMRPGGGGAPSGKMLEQIRAGFGSYEQFVDGMLASAAGLFASGWIWLVQTPSGVDIVATANADTPLTGNMRPLLAVDLWEHAYYLDYQDRRLDYVRAVLDHLLNWEFAAENVRA